MYILTQAEVDERGIDGWHVGDEIFDIKDYLRRPQIMAEATDEWRYVMAAQVAAQEALIIAIAQGLPDQIERHGVHLRSLWDYLASCIPSARDGGEYNLSSILSGWAQMVEAVKG